MTSTAEIQNLASLGKALVQDIERLAGNIVLYNLGKMIVDDDTYGTLDYLERESKKSRLTYHAIHAGIHGRWSNWANDVERTLFHAKGFKTELSRFRKLRDQVNSYYSKRSIDLPSISQKVKEQVAIVERVQSVPTFGAAFIPSTLRPTRKTRVKVSKIDRWITRIQRHPYYKLIIILSGFLGFVLILLRFLAFV